MKKPVVCVISEIPNLVPLLTQRCSSMLSKVISMDISQLTPDDPVLQEAEIIISEPHFASTWLYGLPNLKLVQGTWAGIDRYSVPSINEGWANLYMMRLVSKEKPFPNFTYCRYAGKFGQSMSEYVLAYIVAQERNFKLTYQAQAESRWSDETMRHIWYNSRSLNNLSIGILGLGDIGKSVAKACKALGMTVWGLVNTVPSDVNKSQYVDEYRPSSDLDVVLSCCDYICNILPSTPQTRGLLDNDRFKACAYKKSVFINVGRGDICTEHSVLKALDEGWLRGAILDVLPTDPLHSDSLLWQHPNVTVTPHVASVSMPEQFMELLVENIENYIHERPLKYVIDWSKDY